MHLSGPPAPQPLGDWSPVIVAGLRPPLRPRPRLRRQGKQAPRPRESRLRSGGGEAGKGLPGVWRRRAAWEGEWPGRFLPFCPPPSLTPIPLLPRNLRSEGQKVAFSGRAVKWASSRRGVGRGFPSLNWAQNQALCPRFWPVVRSLRRWAAAGAREI